jgi:hypothetical protein
VPASPVDAGPGYLRALRGRIVERLEMLLPFFRQHLVVMASPHDGLPPELPLPSGGKAPRAAAPIPALPLAPVYAAEGDSTFDVAALPHATGIKNLYLAGLENLPGLGFEGELVSAWGIARLITGNQPRRDPLRRKVLISE